MAVVVLDPAKFKAAFPEFVDVPDARLSVLFALVGSTIIDNTDASPVRDAGERESLMFLLLAHMLVLYGTGPLAGGTGGTGPTGAVGRVSAATEGSVSSSMEYHAAATAGEAWFNQTQYGAMYWVMTAKWRSMRYVAIGRSGSGRALDFLTPRAPLVLDRGP